MKKHSIFKGFIVTAILFSLLLINVDSPRCEAQPALLGNAHSRAKTEKAQAVKTGELELQDDKSQRFQEMEWLIRQNLMKQYERLVISTDLEDLD